MIKSGTTSVAESSIKIDANRLSWVWSHRRSRIWRELRSHSVSRLINASVLPDLGRRLFLNSSFSVSFRGFNLPVAKCCKLHFIRRIISFCFGKRCFRKYEFFSLKMSSDGRRKWVNELTISTQNLFLICGSVIRGRSAKPIDVKTVFTYSHAHTPLGQSEHAYD